MGTERIINEEYWTQFIGFNSITNTSRHDGHRFEDLTRYLLELMYNDKNIIWHPTQMTHDGNKDFIAFDGEKKYWAECKNYKTKIDLKTLAATLVMAEIEDVNTILFFCYSEINDNTKKNLIKFSNSSKKSIYFYDGVVLDQLILKYASYILPVFFPEFKADFNIKKYKNVKITSTILCYLERNPFLNGKPTFDISDMDDLQDLKIGEIIGIHLIVINNNIYENISYLLQLQYLNYENAFEVLDEDVYIRNENIVYNKINVSSGSVSHKIIYLKLRKYLPIVNFPKIVCTIGQNRKKFQFGSIKAQKTVQCSYIGSGYLEKKKKACQECLNQNSLSVIYLYGSSGTGKTRMLYECSDKFIASGYQIITFHNLGGINFTYMMLREIIFALYGFNDELIECIVQNDYENLDNYNIPVYRDIFRIIKEIYNKRYDLSTINQLEYFSIFEKLAKGKYMLVIDDIQYWSNESIEFLKNFFVYASNINRKCHCVVAIAANTDVLYNHHTIEFLSDLENNSNDYRRNIYKHEIVGFDNANQVHLFLKELLGIDEELAELEEVKTLTYRPKFLLEVANYLLDIQAVSIIKNKAVIIDKAFFKASLKQLPISLEKILSTRWELYMKNYKHDNIYYKNLMSCIIFLGKIDIVHDVIGIKYQGDIVKLCQLGFLKKNESQNNIYVFDHDSIRLFFQNSFYDWFETAICYYSKRNNELTNNSLKFICKICTQQNFDIKEYERYRNLNCSNEIRYKVNEHLLCLSLKDKNNSSLYTIIKDIFQNTREQFGEKNAEYFYRLFEELYDITSQRLTIYQYCEIRMDYAENQLKLKQTSTVISICEDILRRLSNLTIPERNYMKSKLFNRWFVCGRVGSYTQKFSDKWNLSMQISRNSRYCDMCIENNFDKAHSLILYPESRIDVIRHLKAGCRAYNCHKPTRLKGQYFYRNIQLLFLQGKYYGLWQKIEAYIDEIASDDNINFKLFFRIQFLIFKITFCLMDKRKYTEFEMENMFEEFNMLQVMQNKLQLYRYYYLYGKYYTKKNRWEKAFLTYKKAFDNLAENVLTEEIRIQRKLICEDMLINFKKYSFPFDKFDFTYLQSFSEGNELQKIIRFSDEEFSVFFQQYVVVAPIADIEKKEGYLLF